MTKFQRRARLLVGVFAVGFAISLAFAFKKRQPPAPPPALVRLDPTAVVESTDGKVVKVSRSREDVSVEYDKQLSYKDGSSKLQGVKITSTDRNDGRSFTVTAKEGSVGQNESEIVLHGDVHLEANDGLSARTEHATYNQNEGIVRAPGPVEFKRNRLSGSGTGMTYDNNRDVLVILEQAHVQVAPSPDASGAIDITSATATFARRDRQVRFEQALRALRGGQIIAADGAVAYLGGDDEHLERVELRGRSSVTAANGAPSAFQALTGQDMDLTYRPDGSAIEHAVITGNAALRPAANGAPGALQALTGNQFDLKYAPGGDKLEQAKVNGSAVLQIAGQKNAPGREITANTLDIVLGPDGSTPVALIGRDNVQLTFPAEQGSGGRTIKAASLDAKGEPGKGLTRALFAGADLPVCADSKTARPDCDVDYREQNGKAGRAAKSATLEVALKPGLSGIDEATFSRRVRFEEGNLSTLSAHAEYLLEKGTLALTGAESAAPRPHIVNEQITIDATRIDVTLDGPKMKATGDVRSVLQPARDQKAQKDQKTETKMPSMLKSDQVVYVSGQDLDYDGGLSKAMYSGASKLWQADTSVQANAITLDNKTGDMTAAGAVTTSAMFEQRDKDQKKERVRSVGTAKDFKYEESARRATYTGDAHLSGPQGDMTANIIELYLKASGDELDRAEAYDKLTLREQKRKTTGTRMTYTTANETYVVTGLPVAIVDECGRETLGQKLTFVKATDTVVVDSGGQVRTQTKGAGKCS